MTQELKKREMKIKNDKELQKKRLICNSKRIQMCIIYFPEEK